MLFCVYDIIKKCTIFTKNYHKIINAYNGLISLLAYFTWHILVTINHILISFFQFQDFRFLCPNDTVFDQQNLVCTNWFEVDCTQSVQLFAQDFGFRAEEEKRQKDKGSGRGNIGR